MPIRYDAETAAIHLALQAVVTRYFQACDRGDTEGVRSCFEQEAKILHHGRPTMNGIQQAIDTIFTPAHAMLESGQAKARTHFMGNFRIEALAGDTAETETYALAAHANPAVPADQINFMSLRYMDRFRRRGGEWRIIERRMTMDWNFAVPAVSAMAFAQRVRGIGG